MIAKMRPLNTLSFAFWGGEEIGLLGSNPFLQRLSVAQQQQIDRYLNVNMVASPNPVDFFGADTGMPLQVGPPAEIPPQRFKR